MSAYDFLLPSLACGLLLYWLELPLRPHWTDHWNAAWIGALMPAMAVAMDGFLELGVGLRPYTYDLYLRQADVILGVQPGVDWLTHHADHIFGLTPLCAVAYMSLPLALALVIHDRKTSSELLWKLGIAGVVGYLLYMVVPGCGPVYIPPNELLASPHPLLIPNWPRNAMPSFHLAATLLIFLNRKPWTPQVRRLLVGPLLVFTALATIISGQHYFVDLLVGAAFAWAVHVYVPRALAYRRPAHAYDPRVEAWLQQVTAI